MSPLLLPIFAVVIGFIVLTYSADRLIAAAATMARYFGLSIVFIGMTIVAFGTSAPEMLVSAIAALNGADGLSVGNAIGSNIINTGLVLGICALVTPIMVSRRFLKREYPILLLVVAFTYLLLAGGEVALPQGVALLIGLILYCVYLARTHNEAEDQDIEFLDISKKRAITETLVMLGLLLASSQVMVWGSVELARAFGVSELVIGLTVIAFGTSLPELAAAIAGVRRGLYDMTLATIIGSNTFNLLGVMAFPGLLGDGIVLPDEVLERDMPMLVAITLTLGLFFVIARLRTEEPQGPVRMMRLSGAMLLVGFSGYMSLLAMAALN
ncbi:calcium/sodium antiporter [Ferrimonas aestuarii]|uniref:Calcium/sodium antiporter n=1 Tax=Ferrimonas aestuarii TaxID=2569539 RepID=A0A4U1BSP7_9GAMM|nr:calcium/sodium antiporter [Ferrimonas aestuarii]TKB56647.1 calcium/sodium antiporter [Ferrimonas aestuarii]